MINNRHDEIEQPDESASSGGFLHRAPITDRINGDPPILNGMTSAEGVYIAVICLLVYGILGIVIFITTHWWHASLTLVMFGTGLTVWYASMFLAKIKRGRPEGYYLQVIHLWMARQGLVRTAFIRHDDYWSLGRNLTFGGFVSPFDVPVEKKAPPSPNTPTTSSTASGRARELGLKAASPSLPKDPNTLPASNNSLETIR